MRKFQFTSKNFDGAIIYGFNDREKIVLLDISGATLSEEQERYIFMNIPGNIGTLNNIYGRQKGGKVEEILQSAPAFADFWASWFRNRHKDNSSKKKAEIRWNRMPAAQQAAAFNYIGKYMMNIPNGTVPKLAEMYLNSEVWEN
ncbi:MAG: hypothetical protein LBK03_04585 [Bacteroidales bacterium]|jgi:hypothetical protein|nr:hypothetical protein [Bacteroidales bacterium]